MSGFSTLFQAYSKSWAVRGSPLDQFDAVAQLEGVGELVLAVFHVFGKVGYGAGVGVEAVEPAHHVEEDIRGDGVGGGGRVQIADGIFEVEGDELAGRFSAPPVPPPPPSKTPQPADPSRTAPAITGSAQPQKLLAAQASRDQYRRLCLSPRARPP